MIFRVFALVSLIWLLGFIPSDAGGVKDTSISAITTTNGKIAFSWDAPPEFKAHIYAINPDQSNVAQLTSGADQEFEPAWSPDGTRIAFSRSLAGGGRKIFVMNADGSNQIAITNGPGDSVPSWSPDGSTIAYLSVTASFELRLINADGSNQRVLVSRSGFRQSIAGPATWSPDGKKIAFAATDGFDGVIHIYVVDSGGANQTALTSGGASDVSPSWSPDGAKILFVRTGTNTLFVMNADGSNQAPVTSFAGQQIFSPVWSPDGQQIALQISSTPARAPNVFVMNANGSGLTPITDNTGVNIAAGVSWQTLHVAPTQNPTLLTEENSERAIALQSVTFARDPFPRTQPFPFGADARTRIAVFAMNIDLQPGETVAAVTASSEDSQHTIRPLTVEFVGKVPNFGWLTQVNLVLSDQLAEGDALISLTYHGVESNKAVIKIK